tara:strand:+ start:578 stop:1543 length:966 start_codon:yes stop_codon:yes gene_type:complete
MVKKQHLLIGEGEDNIQMTDTGNQLMRLNPDRLRGIALSSSNPLDALYAINPEIATLAYAHREKLLSSEILPYVARFRELQSEEKIALIGGLVEKLRIETEGEVAKYRVDGQVEIVRTSEAGLTRRAEIERDSLKDLHKLKYDAEVKMLQAHIDGQKYLSDNQLQATHIEAEAHRHAIETTERLRAETARRVSSDRLEERVRSAAIEFAGRMREAEILREREHRQALSEVARTYIEKQTELCLATFEAEVKMAAMFVEVEKARIGGETERYSSRQETARHAVTKASEILRELIPGGESSARVVISGLETPIEVRYEKEGER